MSIFTMLSLNMLFTAAALSLLISLSTAQHSPCHLTSTSCQCSSADPSGLCLKPHGNGTCLLGECQSGHRCDCFGYELCSINSCSKLASTAPIIPTHTAPFQCHLQQNAATCTSFTSIIETVIAAQYAQTEATSSDHKAARATEAVARKLQAVFQEKSAVRDTLDELERQSVELSVEEIGMIEGLAASVEQEASETAVLLQDTVLIAASCSREKREARRSRNQAVRLQRRADESKGELEREERKQRGGEGVKGECEKCQKLQGKIVELEDGRRNASRVTGLRAQEARGSRRKCERNNRRAGEAVRRAKKASGECVRKARAAIEKRAKRRFV